MNTHTTQHPRKHDRVVAPPGEGHRTNIPTRDVDNKEVTPMQLTDLIDLIGSDIDRTLAEQGVDEPIPCRANDAEIWFAERPEDVEFAKALCRTCPARAQCLAGALDRSEPWGVWGGELLVRGEVVARKRPRGRPRKNPVAA